MESRCRRALTKSNSLITWWRRSTETKWRLEWERSRVMSLRKSMCAHLLSLNGCQNAYKMHNYAQSNEVHRHVWIIKLCGKCYYLIEPIFFFAVRSAHHFVCWDESAGGLMYDGWVIPRRKAIRKSAWEWELCKFLLNLIFLQIFLIIYATIICSDAEHLVRHAPGIHATINKWWRKIYS